MDRPDVSQSLYSRLMASEAALPEVYTTAEPPFIITYANSAWESLCGFSSESAVGRTCAILQGERTCKRTLGQIGEAVAAGLPITVVLINYTRLGAPFTNQLTLEPLCLGPDSPGRITHYVGTLRASPCCETLPVEPQLSTRFECMDMRGCTPTKEGDLSSEQPLPCRQLVEGLIAANGDTPVSLPQLLSAMAYLVPVEMANALVELVGALLRDEVRLSAGEFEGALRILLGSYVSILSELVGWLTLLAPEATGDAMVDAGTARTTLEACKACRPSAGDAGSVSIDDIMAPDLDLPLLVEAT